MSDTTSEIKQWVRAEIMARSPAERFVMRAEIFDSALGMVKASFPTNLFGDEYKRQLFQRLYKNGAARVSCGAVGDKPFAPAQTLAALMNAEQNARAR